MLRNICNKWSWIDWKFGQFEGYYRVVWAREVFHVIFAVSFDVLHDFFLEVIPFLSQFAVFSLESGQFLLWNKQTLVLYLQVLDFLLKFERFLLPFLGMSQGVVWGFWLELLLFHLVDLFLHLFKTNRELGLLLPWARLKISILIIDKHKFFVLTVDLILQGLHFHPQRITTLFFFW